MSFSIPPRIALHRFASYPSSTFSPILLSPSYQSACRSIHRRSEFASLRHFTSSPFHAQQNSSASRTIFDHESPASGPIQPGGPVGASRSANGSAGAGKSASTHGDRSATSVLEQEIKSIVQHIPYAIVVLTTGVGNDTGTWRGMTLSSFTTLSMRPTPLATINIKTPSHTLTQLLQSRRCVINVLLRNKDGIKCASTFANPNSPLAAQREQFLRERSDATEAPGNEAAAGVGGNELPYYGPPLREDAVYLSLDCSVHKTLLVQDHTLVVLEIVRANRNRKLESMRDHEALFYKRRDYDLISEGTKTPFFLD